MLERVRRWIILALLLVGAASAAAGASAQARNPFGSGSPGPSTPAPPKVEERAREPGFLDRIVGQINVWQRQLNERLSREIRDYKESGSLAPVFAILLVSFLYGVFHAVGPGHGKVMTTAYFAANRARYANGLAMTGMISLIQALSAILIVGTLAVLLGFKSTRIVDNVTYVEAASNFLIAGVGLYIVFGGITGRGCSHDHGTAGAAHAHHDHAHEHTHAPHGHPHHDHASAPVTATFRSMAAAAFASGIRPCTGAILVLLFTLSHGIFGIGIVAALVMALGVFLVLAAIGIGVIFARSRAGRAGARNPRLANLAHRAAGIAGGGVIVAFGGLLFLASLKTLGYLT
jgi:ABC-type nickel/cobalt efflux system permease component RcnA